MESEPAPGPLSSVDLTLLRAATVWGGDDTSGLWEHFPTDRRASLRWGMQTGLAGEPDSALDRLRREHAAQARADLSRVHVSWWVRALQDEAASVQRAVAAHLPRSIAGALREGLGLAPDDLVPDRPAEPGALGIALALWTDRLVGDLAEREDDPPAVVALSQFDAPTVARLFQTTGLAKWVLTSHPLPDLDRRDLERVEPLRAMLAGVDARYLQVAARDIEALTPVTSGRSLARAGMTTFARLLLAAEPYRVRWALQHLPYSTARSLRNLMGPGARRAPMLVRWETDVLRAAWTRLHDEGRVSARWGVEP